MIDLDRRNRSRNNACMRRLLLLAVLMTPSLAFSHSAVIRFADGVSVDHDEYWSGSQLAFQLSDNRNGLITPDVIRQQAANIVRTRSGSAGGSGCYLGARLVLICRHTIGRVGRFLCMFDSSVPPFQIYGRVIATGKGVDTALVELDSYPPLPGIRIASENPSIGDDSYALGYATGRLGCHPGKVIRFAHNGSYVEQSGGAISGDSGGPILNARGELIGNLWGYYRRGTTVGLVTGRTTRFLAPYSDRLSAWYTAVDAGKQPWTDAIACPT